jgi:hypothetical protein
MILFKALAPQLLGCRVAVIKAAAPCYLQVICHKADVCVRCGCLINISLQVAAASFIEHASNWGLLGRLQQQLQEIWWLQHMPGKLFGAGPADHISRTAKVHVIFAFTTRLSFMPARCA